jgi:hypothetical protein
LLPPDVNEAGRGDQGSELGGTLGVAAAARSARLRDPVEGPEGGIEVPAEDVLPPIHRGKGMGGEGIEEILSWPGLGWGIDVME